MDRWKMRRLEVHHGALSVAERGTGEPVVLIQTALTADELVPLADRLVRGGARRVVIYHRRGYGESSPARRPGSILRDAQDCIDLLSALSIAAAHLVSTSYGAAVALEAADLAPDRVSSLVLSEPPPIFVPSGQEFVDANVRLVEQARREGAHAALEGFLSFLVGPDWRVRMERQVPGSVAQMWRDAGTFFESDVPALLAWRFGPVQARRIRCPVLHVGGGASGPWFAQVRRQLLAWIPDAVDVVLPDAGHTLAITHTRELSSAVVTFLPGPAEPSAARRGPCGSTSRSRRPG